MPTIQGNIQRKSRVKTCMILCYSVSPREVKGKAQQSQEQHEQGREEWVGLALLVESNAPWQIERRERNA